jgi:omega-hydroxy-beta-dihydromenaquinone-9 sulfotransferase
LPRWQLPDSVTAEKMAEKLKHRWSLQNNYLAGITTADWLRLLRENRFDVDSAYWHRALFITLTSLMNSYFRRKEVTLYQEKIDAVTVQAPLFVLGHWRSGTTHLHNLLAQDSEQFAYANTYQVVNPHTFLTTEASHAKRFAWMVPKTRPMDQMALSFQSPQEDEFGPCLMSLYSLYLSVSFPKREDYYARYLDFLTVPQHEIEQWKAALCSFLKKLTFKHQQPLILKSPPHTARIKLLLELFPDARFVFIHRDPYQVFQSCRHYYDTASWFTYLQRPDLARIDERIIQRYLTLHDAYHAQKSLIPKGQLHELSFEELEKNPLSTMRSLYHALDLNGFESLEAKLARYIGSLGNYRKNDFIALSQSTKAMVANVWQRSFEQWNYPI